MDLTLRRQPQGERQRSALRALGVPVAALGGAALLSTGLLLVLSDLVARLG